MGKGLPEDNLRTRRSNERLIMGKITSVNYANATFSPWYGCAKVSPGCAHCSAERWAKRSGMVEWGPGKPRRLASEAKWRGPLKWNKEAKIGQFVRTPQTEADLHSYPEPVSAHAETRVLVDLCDWLDSEVPVEWLCRFLSSVSETVNLTWLLLSKRPEQFPARLAAAYAAFGRTVADPGSRASEWVRQWLAGNPPHNVWLGVSVENQEMAEKRIPILRASAASVRWISFEPLLGHIDLRRLDRVRNTMGLSFAVIGGESGPGHREMPMLAFEELIDQLRWLRIPIWVKQDSGPRPGMQGRIASDLWAIKQLPLSTQKTP